MCVCVCLRALAAVCVSEPDVEGGWEGEGCFELKSGFDAAELVAVGKGYASARECIRGFDGDLLGYCSLFAVALSPGENAGPCGG